MSRTGLCSSSMTVIWSDDIDAVIGGDLTCGLAYATPAGGAVVSVVAPLGIRDSKAGTVGFTTSLGFGRKLERIKRDPRVSLVYHAREHGLANPTDPRYVVVQGTASFSAKPGDYFFDWIDDQSEPYVGALPRGRLWDWWLSAY